MRSNRPYRGIAVAGWIVIGIVTAGAFALLFGFLVVWLWNALMPELFDFPPLNYWQAVGLLLLAKLFFGSHGHRRRPSSRKWKRWQNWNHENYDMKPEDWRHFRDYWREGGKEHFRSWREASREAPDLREDED